MIKILVDGFNYHFGIFREEEFLHGEVCNRDRLVDLIVAFEDEEISFTCTEDFLLDDIYYVLPHLRGTTKVTYVKNLEPLKVMESWLPTQYMRSKRKRNRLQNVLLASIGIIVGSLLLSSVSAEYKESVLIVSQLKAQKAGTAKEDNTVKTLDWNSLYRNLQQEYQSSMISSIELKKGVISVTLKSKEVVLPSSNTEPFMGVTPTRYKTEKDANGDNENYFRMEVLNDSARAG